VYTVFYLTLITLPQYLEKTNNTKNIGILTAILLRKQTYIRTEIVL